MIKKSQIIPQPSTLALASVLLACGLSGAQAHVSYTNRDFGTFSGYEATVTKLGAVAGNYGWADGTDADFGDSHKVRAFRFTLANTATVTLSVTGVVNGTAILGLNPAYSIYEGLAHLAPLPVGVTSADYDYSLLSADYLASLGGVAKEGAFRALDTWRMGGDGQTGPVFDYNGLSTFNYAGHAADGTSANYGAASGIVGDGLLDGTVTGTFTLPAGNYSVFIGGTQLGTQGTDTSYGISASMTVVPEPATGAVLLLAGGIFLRRRR